MADYRKIVELDPAVADFLSFQSTIGTRGDVLAYAANIDGPNLSTDGQGFRHTAFDGRRLAAVDCQRAGRYGLVLGASNSFGFGVAGNENTMASVVSARLGIPFANCAMPGANSRTLHSLLVSVIAAAPRPPSVVVYSSGGDLGNFCDAGVADPVFGSPNRNQIIAEFERGRAPPDAEFYFPHLLNFTSLWAAMIARTCRRQKADLVMVHQATFFEKASPSPREREVRLGEAFNVHHERMFANHRRFNAPYFARRKEVADRLGVPLAGWEAAGQWGFIDEFHLDAAATSQLSELVALEIEEQVSRRMARVGGAEA